MKKQLLQTVLGMFLITNIYASTFTAGSNYNVCFTPGGNCTDLIVSRIENAKKSIFVQAYSFTSAPIEKALMQAKRRGVDVEVILDKSQFNTNGKYTSSTFLLNQNIPTFLDYKPAIAHNKVMIIDACTVITGSFNFTKAAQERNAENSLIIDDQQLAKIYKNNWDSRYKESINLADERVVNAYLERKNNRKRKQFAMWDEF